MEKDLIIEIFNCPVKNNIITETLNKQGISFGEAYFFENI